MENSKLKQWIKVISPALVYMLLFTAFKEILDLVFANTNLDLLGNIEKSVFTSSLSVALMFPIVLVWYCIMNKPIHIKKLESFQKYISLIVEIAIMSFAIATAITFLMDSVYGNLHDNSTASLFEIISAAIIAPICEELIYRDVVFKRCSLYFGNKLFAIIFSGILFGIAHSGSAMQILISVIVGIVFNLIYLQYRSVIVTILVHIGVNLLSYCKWLTELPNIVLVLGFVSLAIMIAILIYHFNDEKGRIVFKEE